MVLISCSNAKDIALIEAAGRGDVPLITKLIADGANVNAKALDDLIPLTQAADQGQLDAARILIARGADVNGKSGLLSPLFFAAWGGHVDVAKLIINSGGRLDLPEVDRAIFVAKIQKYNNPILSKLLENDLR
jgi:uncharacterized protein